MVHVPESPVAVTPEPAGMLPRLLIYKRAAPSEAGGTCPICRMKVIGCGEPHVPPLATNSKGVWPDYLAAKMSPDGFGDTFPQGVQSPG